MIRKINSLFFYLVFNLFCFFIQTVAHASETEIIHGLHIRNMNYGATFRYTGVHQEEYSVYLSESVSVDPSFLSDMIKIIQADINLIKSKLELSAFPEINLYIVPSISLDTIQWADKNIYCSAADIESGAYRTALVSSILNLEKLWVAVGVLSYIDEKAVHKSDIQNYLLSHGSDILYLWDTRFLEELNEVEDVEIAAQVAALLVNILIQDGDVAALENPPQDLAIKLCAELSLPSCIDQTLVNLFSSFKLKRLSDAQVSVTTPTINYMFDLADGYFKSAEELEDFIVRSEVGLTQLMAYLKKNVSAENFNWMQDNLLGVNCQFKVGSSQSVVSPIDNKIIIDRVSALQRELSQTMVNSSYRPYIVILEGLGMYFDLVLFPNSYLSEWLHYKIPFEDETDLSGFCTKDCSAAEKRDFFEFLQTNWEQISENIIRSDETTSMFSTKFQDMKYYRNVNEPGVDLTMIQSAFVFSDLIEDYGLDKILDYLRSGGPFENSFEVTLSEYLF